MELSPTLVARPFLVQTGEVSTESGFVLPAGTVTFLLTDVEGSTRLWHDRPDDMPAAIARHYEILDDAIGANGGVRPVEQGEGDSVVGAFARVTDAMAAALQAQRALLAELPWLPVRMAIHTGDAQLRDEGNYVGRTIIRCARLRACGHGGQILVSETSASLAGDSAPDEVTLNDLGSARLRDLSRAERVWQLAHAELPSSFPALRSLDAAPHNLPTPLTSFIGRDAEQAAIAALLRDHRLVTLAGSGGAGKTRLAQHSAADAVGHHRGGTWWVELAPVTSGDQVADRVASSVGFSLAAGIDPLAQLTRFINGQGEVLVVLDNAEHVIDDVARVAQAIVAGCPAARVLVTSREPIGVPGEVVWRVPSLSIPGPAEQPTIERLETFDAVRLFLERARHARPNLVVDDSVAPAVASICARLDGIPLALELAAARARSLPLDKLAAGLDDSFRLLTGGARTVMARQQTLLASIAWSVDLLDDIERAVLRRLAVFVAPFTLDAAEAVAADGELVSGYDVLDTLGRLVDKSLVQFDDESGRYRLLETVRQYSLDRLRDGGEVEATRSRHSSWFATWCEHVVEGRYGIDRRALYPDVPDVFAAARWARECKPVDALRMIGGLAWARVSIGDVGQMNAEYEFVLNADRDENPTLWAKAAAALAGISLPLGRFELLALADDIESRLDPTDATSRQRMKFMPAVVDALNGNLAPMESIVAWMIETGNEGGTLMGSGTATLGASMNGDFAACERHVATIKAVLDRHGAAFTVDTATAGFAGWALALTYQGRFDEARALFADTRQPNDSYFTFIAAMALSGLAWVLDDLNLSETAARWVGREAQPIHETAQRLVRAIDAMMHDRLDEAKVEMDAMPGILGTITTATRSGFRLMRNAGWLATGDIELVRARNESIAESVVSAPLPSAINALARAQLAVADGRDPTADAHRAIEEAHAIGASTYVIDGLECAAIGASRRSADTVAARLLGACRLARDAMGYRGSIFKHWFDFDALVATVADTPAFAEGQALTLDAAVEYAQRTRGERGRPAHGWASLTPTELQVAELVAEGKTNQQIATQLLMGVATVKSHLTHIYNKLGIMNRAALAVEAVSAT